MGLYRIVDNRGARFLAKTQRNRKGRKEKHYGFRLEGVSEDRHRPAPFSTKGSRAG
jgi:hypothetical protein